MVSDNDDDDRLLDRPPARITSVTPQPSSLQLDAATTTATADDSDQKMRDADQCHTAEVSVEAAQAQLALQLPDLDAYDMAAPSSNLTSTSTTDAVLVSNPITP